MRHRRTSWLWTLVALAVVVPLSQPACARPVHVWTLEEIVEKADVIVVGEVTAVSVADKIAPAETPWKLALLRMRAEVRVLRVFSPPGGAAGTISHRLSVAYRAIDWERTDGVVNGPDFPQLAVGEVRAFPLQQPRLDEQDRWLIGEEDFGLLVPGTQKALADAPRETGTDFLLAELAGAFALGEYRQVYDAGGYLSQSGGVGSDLAARTYRLLTRHVPPGDTDRWLDIAVASYCASGTPRPTIAKLVSAPGGADSRAAFAASALRHVPKEGLDDRFIEAAIRHADVHLWGTESALQDNYPRHPTTLRLLRSGLEAGSPEAFDIAAWLIRDPAHPLIPEAVPAARRELAEREKVSLHPADGDWRAYQTVTAACELIRDYGDQADFRFLLGELRDAKQRDRNRYAVLWHGSAYAAHGENPRMVEICRIAIDDRGVLSRDRRFCDVATTELNRVTHVDFGWRSEQSEAQRDGAVARAKAWLATH